MTAVIWLGVALCGGAGAVARFLVDSTVARKVGGAFPIGTFVVNVSGAVLLGLLSGLALSHTAALLAGTGVVGAYTTFSTWMFETDRAGDESRWGVAAVNVVASLVFGIAAAALGRWIGLQL